MVDIGPHFRNEAKLKQKQTKNKTRIRTRTKPNQTKTNKQIMALTDTAFHVYRL